MRHRKRRSCSPWGMRHDGTPPAQKGEKVKKNSLASSEVLRAEHLKLKEKIVEIDPLTDELEAIDRAHDAGEWLQSELGTTKEALRKLEERLVALHRWKRAHWQREGRELIPFLRDNGQEAFCDQILKEHRLMGLRSAGARRKLDKLQIVDLAPQRFMNEVSAVRANLAGLFALMEGHANREEQMLFQLEHG